jgi:hypothetical protein
MAGSVVTGRRRLAVAGGAAAALALCGVAAVALLAPAGGRFELAGRPAGGLAGVARLAEETLHQGIAKLGSGSRSLQKTRLSAEMSKALAAVQELKGKLPTAAAADAAYSGASAQEGARRAKGSRGRSARARPAAAQQAEDTVHKSLAKVRITAQHAKADAKLSAPGDMEASDNLLVRDELRKMVEVAKRLSGQMKKMPSAAERAAERVKRKLGAVAHAASAMEEAAAEEEAARKRVVAHELEVRKQKLAEAEEEELAAARAAKEAIAAERLAVKKHNEAAADEVAAHERRVAARRARAIAARGEEGKKSLEEAAESADSLFPKEVEEAKEDASTASTAKKAQVKSELDKYAPSKSAVAKGCIDTIATYGCGGLMAENPCLAYCGTDNDVRRAARARNTAKGLQQPVETGYAVHDRTGYFATGKDRDTYVDAVYGREYDPSTYTHERSGFFTSSSGHRSSLLAPEVETATGGFTDVAADGQDREEERSTESMGSAQQVLRNEETLKRRLEGSLEQEQAQNSLLRQRLAKQESAMRSV